eukprot:maker-scaffold_50-snap-gene-0.1-mRNA-1 protein AED:0.17 eAED:0.17 QI:101/1/1/1/1/1/2/50/351
MSQLCPCGLSGENCSILDPALDSLDEALDELCSAEGFQECFTDSDLGANCVCECGFTGDLCETRQEPLLYIQILGILIPLLLIGICIYAIYAINTPMDTSFPRNPERLVDGGILPASVLLVYRFCVMLIGYIILGSTLSRFGLDELRFFTYWTWIGFTFYFTLATYLSYKYVFPGTLGGSSFKIDFSKWDRTLFVTFEVMFVITIIITILTWLILFPLEQENGTEGDLLALRSYFFHGGNAGFMLVDFFFTSVIFIHKHVFYSMLVVSTYVLFHGLLLVTRDLQGKTMCSVYSFFDQDTPIFFAYSFGFLFLLYVLHGLMILFSKLKDFCNCNVESTSSLDKSANIVDNRT